MKLIRLFVAGCLFLWQHKVDCLQSDKQASIEFWDSIGETALREKLLRLSGNVRRPKNVIVFIGDGMGTTAVTGARMYKQQKIGADYLHRPLHFETFSHTALVKTHSYTKHVTDSAAGAMALFGGRKVDQNSLGRLPSHPADCSTFNESQIDDGIAELAVNRGIAVGFATTTRITHATPGALYAKGVERWLEFDSETVLNNSEQCRGRDIASQLLQHPANKFKVLMGGGAALLKPKESGGDRSDGRDLTEEWSQLGGRRTVIGNPKQLEELDLTKEQKVLGLFTPQHLPYYLDEVTKGVKTVPRLSEMTEKAIRVLQKDNDKGYFLMIEGGMIDQAEHINKLRLAFEELLEMDEAVKMAREMTSSDDTLIIVTADHSHAMSIPGYVDSNSSIFDASRNWGQRANDTEKIPGLFFATGPGSNQTTNYTRADSDSPHFVSPAAYYMEYGAHGGEDVGLWADGPGAELFTGSMENTEVAYYIKYLMCLTGNDRSKCERNEKKKGKESKEDEKKDEEEELRPRSQVRRWRDELVARLGSDLLVLITIGSLLVAAASIVCALVFSAMLYNLRGRRMIFSHDSESTLVK